MEGALWLGQDDMEGALWLGQDDMEGALWSCGGAATPCAIQRKSHVMVSAVEASRCIRNAVR